MLDASEKMQRPPEQDAALAGAPAAVTLIVDDHAKAPSGDRADRDRRMRSRAGISTI